jgi:hypothetical protein
MYIRIYINSKPLYEESYFYHAKELRCYVYNKRYNFYECILLSPFILLRLDKNGIILYSYNRNFLNLKHYIQNVH